VVSRDGRSELKELVDGDDVTAAGTLTTRTEPPAEPLAFSAALLAEVARLALRAFVNDVVATGFHQVGGSEFEGELLPTMTAAEGDHPAPLGAESRAR